ncbi:AI-2E family transporter [Coprobacter tertius]|uniref:AI-2E family transporter n=1 Tax=Coprobacter tertius TaxID=2944915 RepID=A0ABT1MJQ9_9BACT|nr:AI-2E family transporter [Coprobacter tertius]MCP9612279.1 AI-2E family transporter [Coprobacter tertius]
MSIKEQYWKYSLITLILGLGTVIFIYLTPFMSGLLGAFTIYLLLRNQMRQLTTRRKIKRGLAAILILMEAILCFLIPLSLIVWLMVNKIQDINLDPQSIISPIQHFASVIKEKTGYNLLANDNISSIAAMIPRIGQALMSGISSFAINIFTLIFVLYFMLIGGKKMENYINEILPFNKTDKRHILNEVNMIVKSNAIGIPLLAIIQGGVALIGYLIFNAPNPYIWGLLTCFATIIPVIGTAIVWLPLVIYMATTGDIWNAVGIAIYAIVIITHVDNLIRFVLQKKMADTHPLITIFGVVIGLPIFGFMGVIFGPLLLAIFILCISIFKKEYLDTSP